MGYQDRPQRSGATLYSEVTDRIVAQIEEGTLPWVRPWDDGRAALGLPRNGGTGRRYSGINVLTLWHRLFEQGYGSQRWLTYQQARTMGGNVRKGEQGVTVFYADIERLFVRDDWFVHATIAFALEQTQGEGRLALNEFNENLRAYLSALARFFEGQGIVGPFAVTIALRGLEADEHFGAWFPRTSVVRILRPRLLQGLDDPQFVQDFLLKVRQASLYG